MTSSAPGPPLTTTRYQRSAANRAWGARIVSEGARDRDNSDGSTLPFGAAA